MGHAPDRVTFKVSKASVHRRLGSCHPSLVDRDPSSPPARPGPCNRVCGHRSCARASSIDEHRTATAQSSRTRQHGRRRAHIRLRVHGLARHAGIRAAAGGHRGRSRIVAALCGNGRACRPGTRLHSRRERGWWRQTRRIALSRLSARAQGRRLGNENLQTIRDRTAAARGQRGGGESHLRSYWSDMCLSALSPDGLRVDAFSAQERVRFQPAHLTGADCSAHDCRVRLKEERWPT